MKKHLPIIVLVLVGLIVGLYALPGYGESVDELSQHSYAERTIQAVNPWSKLERCLSTFLRKNPNRAAMDPPLLWLSCY